LQSTSGVFSIASHCGLQYFPELTVQEQMGCAHLLSFPIAIGFLQRRLMRRSLYSRM
jgi:hypothetical protein